MRYAAGYAKSGPLSQKCADALLAQAESERKGGDCSNAMVNYDNAKQAAQNAGTIVMMSLKQGDGRTECENKLHPQKAATAVAYGKGGAVPVGRYTCYSAPAVIANGGAYGRTVVQVGSFQGYAYILSSNLYAGNGDGRDTGHYRMSGTKLIALDGPYKRNNVAAEYMADGVYHRPTLRLAFLDEKGKPLVGLGCTWDGAPAGR